MRRCPTQRTPTTEAVDIATSQRPTQTPTAERASPHHPGRRDDWHQLALLTRAAGQRTYGLIRPVVLFGQSRAERAGETGSAPPASCRHGHMSLTVL